MTIYGTNLEFTQKSKQLKPPSYALCQLENTVGIITSILMNLPDIHLLIQR